MIHAIVCESCVNVRRGNILLRSDERQNLGSVPARHALELGLAHSLRIADHAALAAAEGNIYSGHFPRHPGCERFHFLQRHGGMITNATLSRAARHVVLHPVSGEHFHLAVVHFCRNGYFQHALRGAQDLPQPLVELQMFSSQIKLNLRNPVGIQILARGYARYRLWNRFGNARHILPPAISGPGCR